MLTIFELCESKPKITNEIHHQCNYIVLSGFSCLRLLCYSLDEIDTIWFSFLEKMFFSCLKINDY